MSSALSCVAVGVRRLLRLALGVGWWLLADRRLPQLVMLHVVLHLAVVSCLLLEVRWRSPLSSCGCPASRRSQVGVTGDARGMPCDLWVWCYFVQRDFDAPLAIASALVLFQCLCILEGSI